MRKIGLLAVLVFVVFLIACDDKKGKETYYTQLISALESSEKTNIEERILEDAKLLKSRAIVSGYELISPKDLAKELDSEKYIIISTLPRGIYHLGLIKGAKNFEFSLSPNLNENGSEWNWELDALGRAQSEFVEFLGEDKNAKIIFYESGEHILSPLGSAHIGLMWARHLGYTNLYRLAGGQNAWKDLGLTLVTTMPSCCADH